MKYILFFNPSHYYGGVSVLFSRLFFYIKNDLDHNVKFVDYDDGFLGKQLTAASKKSLISFPNPTEGDLEYLEKTNDYVVICSSSSARKVKAYFNRLGLNPTILIWVFHPFELSIQFFYRARKLVKFGGYPISKLYLNLFFLKKIRLKKFIKLGLFKNSIFFMDGACVRATGYFLNMKKEFRGLKTFLPVPVDKRKSKNIKVKDNNELVFGYLGRIADFKTIPLLNFIKDLSALKNIRVKLLVIGDGSDLHFVKKKCLELYPNLSVNFLGSLSNEKSCNIIGCNVDVLAAMGTAALDGASMEKPTILLAPCEKNIKEKYKYNWLHKTNDFCLGDYFDSPWYKEDSESLQELVNQLSSNFDLISKKSYLYVHDYHSVGNVAKKVIIESNKSSLKINDIPFKNIQI